MVQSQYVEVTTPRGETVKIKPCQNKDKGCKESIYWFNGEFKEFSTGNKHVCQFYNQNNNKPSNPNPNTRNNNNNNQDSIYPQKTNEQQILDELKKVNYHLENLAVNMKLVAKSLEWFEKLLEYRYKELRDPEPLAKHDKEYQVPTEEQLAYSKSSEQEAKEFQNDI